MKTFYEWLETIPKDELDKIELSDVWRAAVDATIEALVDEGNIDEYYRDEWMATVNKVKKIYQGE